MHSRGVVTGDVERANDAWNERLGGIEEAEGVDLDNKPGYVSRAAFHMMFADIFDFQEARACIGGLLGGYLGIERPSPMSDLLMDMLLHAGALGVLAERQRWDVSGMGVREARLQATLMRIATDPLSSREELRDMAQEALSGPA